jgi:hypothetical protein
LNRGEDSSVVTATGWGPDDRGSVSARGKVFLFFTALRPVLEGTHPPIQWETLTCSSGVKRQGRETNHPPPSSAEVKNVGAMPSFLHMSSWYSAELIN